MTLTNQKAIFWEDHRTLILSDLHLGKGAHFRRHGIAVPSDVGAGDLALLQQLLRYYCPRSLIIVGDFIHAGKNSEVVPFSRWRSEFPKTAFILVKGNHDRLSDPAVAKLGIDEIYDELPIGSILLRHEFDPFTATLQVNGHLHPGVSIRLPTKGILRLPCYVQTEKQLILPAFSRFTGLDTRNTPPHAVRYAFYEEDIFMLRQAK